MVIGFFIWRLIPSPLPHPPPSIMHSCNILCRICTHANNYNDHSSNSINYMYRYSTSRFWMMLILLPLRSHQRAGDVPSCQYRMLLWVANHLPHLCPTKFLCLAMPLILCPTCNCAGTECGCTNFMLPSGTIDLFTSISIELSTSPALSVATEFMLNLDTSWIW